ncbi:MAG: hypothetical protein AB1486_25180 [Planctomycetota bacterium]
MASFSRNTGDEARVGSLRWTAWATYERLDELYVGSSRETDPVDETVDIFQTSIDLEYRFHPRWSASVTANYLDIFQRIEGSGVRRRESGIGDTVLLAHWTALRFHGAGEPEAQPGWLEHSSLVLMFDIGTSVPTGESVSSVDSASGTPVSSLQTGTGTFNPVLGGHLRLDWGRVAAALEASTVVPFYENRYDFQAGAFQSYRMNLEVMPVSDLRLALGLAFEHRSSDRIDGESIAAGGGWRYLLYPQAVASLGGGAELFFGAQVPFHRNFDTHQLDSAVKWELGIALGF